MTHGDRRRFLPLLGLALLLAACASFGPTRSSTVLPAVRGTPTATTTDPAVAASPTRAGGAVTPAPVSSTSAATAVTRQASPTVADCSRETVEQMVLDFVAAFNRGDQQQLARFFPERALATPSVIPIGEETAFRYYRIGHFADGRYVQDFIATRPAEALAYFAERHRQRERLQLRVLSLGIGPDEHGIMSISFAFLRYADDIPEQAVTGKGSIDCPNRTILHWGLVVMEGQSTPRPGGPVPTPHTTATPQRTGGHPQRHNCWQRCVLP